MSELYYKKKYLKYKHKYSLLKNAFSNDMYTLHGGFPKTDQSPKPNPYENVLPSGLAIRSGQAVAMPPVDKPQLPQAVIKVAELRTQENKTPSPPGKPPGVYENVVIGKQAELVTQKQLRN